MQRATSATSNKQIFQQVKRGFMQQATSSTIKEWIFQLVKSEFLQQAVSTTSNEPILQRATSKNNEWISRSNKQRVIYYTSSLL